MCPGLVSTNNACENSTQLATFPFRVEGFLGRPDIAQAYSSVELWYELGELLPGGCVEVGVDGQPFIELTLYEGSACGNLTEIARSRDLSPALTLAPEADRRYFVMLSDYYTPNDDQFELVGKVSC